MKDPSGEHVIAAPFPKVPGSVLSVHVTPPSVEVHTLPGLLPPTTATSFWPSADDAIAIPKVTPPDTVCAVHVTPPSMEVNIPLRVATARLSPSAEDAMPVS
jgi:hypothetical protein